MREEEREADRVSRGIVGLSDYNPSVHIHYGFFVYVVCFFLCIVERLMSSGWLQYTSLSLCATLT